jgi:hypothetical protein
VGKRGEATGLTFPKLGDKYYVFDGGKNVLMGFPTIEAAKAAAVAYYDKKRKRTI